MTENKVTKLEEGVHSDRGASLVEYALLLALIAVVCIGALTFLGGSTSNSYEANTLSMFHP